MPNYADVSPTSVFCMQTVHLKTCACQIKTIKLKSKRDLWSGHQLAKQRRNGWTVWPRSAGDAVSAAGLSCFSLQIVKIITKVSFRGRKTAECCFKSIKAFMHIDFESHRATFWQLIFVGNAFLGFCARDKRDTQRSAGNSHTLVFTMWEMSELCFFYH